MDKAAPAWGCSYTASSLLQFQVVVFVSQSATLREARYPDGRDIQGDHRMSYSASVVGTSLLLEGQRSSGTQAVGQGGLQKTHLAWKGAPPPTKPVWRRLKSRPPPESRRCKGRARVRYAERLPSLEFHHVKLSSQQDRMRRMAASAQPGGGGGSVPKLPPKQFLKGSHGLGFSLSPLEQLWLWPSHTLRSAGYWKMLFLRQCASLGRTSRSRLNLPLQGPTESHNYRLQTLQAIMPPPVMNWNMCRCCVTEPHMLSSRGAAASVVQLFHGRWWSWWCWCWCKQ